MLSIWTIYDHPRDFPDHFVARLFVLDKPTATVLVGASLEDLRDVMAEAGLVRLTRDEADDPKIVEVWM